VQYHTATLDAKKQSVERQSLLLASVSHYPLLSTRVSGMHHCPRIKLLWAGFPTKLPINPPFFPEKLPLSAIFGSFIFRQNLFFFAG